MGEMYDFQTNYMAKIEESIRLIEKGYIDQAICKLEDFLVIVKEPKIEHEVKKQLVTAYLLKGEFETSESLISEIMNRNGLDLSVAAHDILVTMFQAQEQKAMQKQKDYQQALGLTALTHKNLIELVYQLKTYYESFWYETVDKKIQVLEREGSIETQLLVLSDLREVEASQLKLFKERFEMIFKQCSIPLVRTMLFELLAQKEIECLVHFKHDQNSQLLKTTNVNLESFYAKLEESLVVLSEMPLDEVTSELLKQHLIFFYQFVFPFVDEMNTKEVIKELAQSILGVTLELESENSSFEKTEKITGIRYKMSQYILSLSSLM